MCAAIRSSAERYTLVVTTSTLYSLNSLTTFIDITSLQANKAPSIPTLTGHNIVSEFGDNGEVVLKAKLGQSLHSIVIEQIVKLAIEELGSTEDLVRIIGMINDITELYSILLHNSSTVHIA